MPNDTIDNIQIEINASASKAANNIERLAKQLSSLQSVVKGVSAASFTNIANGIRAVGEATSSVKPKSVEKINNLISILTRMQNISMPKGMGTAMANMASGVNQIGQAVSSIGPKEIGTLSSLIGTMSYMKNISVPKGIGAEMSKVSQGVRDVASAASSFSMQEINNMANLIRTLSYMKSISIHASIGNNLSKIAYAIGTFTAFHINKLREVVDILKELEGLNNLNLNIRVSDGNIKTRAKEISDSVKDATSAVNAEKGAKASDATTATAAEMKEVAEAANEASDKTSKGMKKSAKEIKEAQKRAEEFKKTLKDIALSFTAGLFGKDIFGNFLKGLNAKGISSFLGSSIRKSVTTPISLALSGIQRLRPAVSSVFESFSKGMSKFMSLSTLPSKLLAAPIKSVGNNLRGMAKHITGLYNSLKRVALYRLLRTVIKAFTQGLKEGIENLYQYSAVVGTEFKRSMDSMATSALYMKNSLATIAEPIINQIAPLIDMLADRFAALAAQVAHFLAALTGQTQYSIALKFFKEYQEAVSDSAKEMQKWLGPFDEINRLSSNNGSRSADDLDYKKMFETIVITDDSIISQIVNQIKESFEKADFTSIGKIVGSKLRSALDNIQWDEIKKKAKKIASSVGTFISGFFTAPGFGNSVGKAIAEAINSAFTFLSTLKDKLKFKEIGKTLGEALSSFFKNFNFKQYVGTISGFGKGFVEFLSTAITTAKWSTLSKRIAEAIDSIDWDNIKQSIRNFGLSIGGAINEFFTEPGFANSIGEAIVNGINTGIGGIASLKDSLDFGGLGTALGNSINSFFESFDFNVLIDTVFGFATGLVTFLSNAIETVEWGSIAEKIKNGLESIDWEDIKKTAIGFGKSIGDSITDFVTAPGFGESIGRTIANAINTAVTFAANLKDSLDFEALGRGVGNGLKNLLENFDFNKFIGAVVGFGTGIITFLANAIGTVPWDEVGEKIGKAIRDIDWRKAFESIKALGTNTLHALFDVIIKVTEDGSLGAIFEEFGRAIGEVLADPELWKKAFKAVTGLGGAIIQGLTGAISGATGIDIDISQEGSEEIFKGIILALGLKKVLGWFGVGAGTGAAAGAAAGVGAGTGASVLIPAGLSLAGLYYEGKLIKDGVETLFDWSKNGVPFEYSVKSRDSVNEFGEKVGEQDRFVESITTRISPPSKSGGSSGRGVGTPDPSRVRYSYINMGNGKVKVISGQAPDIQKTTKALESLSVETGKAEKAIAKFVDVPLVQEVTQWKQTVSGNLIPIVKKSQTVVANSAKSITLDMSEIGASADNARKGFDNLQKTTSRKNVLGETNINGASIQIQNSAKNIALQIGLTEEEIQSLKRTNTGKNPLGENGFDVAANSIRNSAKTAMSDIEGISAKTNETKGKMEQSNLLGQNEFGVATKSIQDSAKSTMLDIEGIEKKTAEAKSKMKQKNLLGQDEFGNATKIIKNSAKDVSDNLSEMTGGYDELHKKFKTKDPLNTGEFEKNARALMQSAKGIISEIDGISETSKNAKTSVSEFGKSFESIKTGTDTMQRALNNGAKGMVGKLKEMTTEVDGFKTKSLMAMDSFGNGLQDGMSKTMQSFVEDGKGGLSTMLENYQTFGSETARLMHNLGESFDPRGLKSYRGPGKGRNPFSEVTPYAAGGFVDSGEIFIARENNRTELIGRIGNKTGVANNEQIIEGIAAGVEDANEGVINAIYSVANQIIGSIRENRGKGGVDWDAVTRKVSSMQARQAASAYK